MNVPAYVETWKSVADYMKRSERWCRYMAGRKNDPLPVYKVGGIIRMNEVDVLEWLDRQKINKPAVAVISGKKLAV